VQHIYPRKRKAHENQPSLSSGGLQARGRWLGLPRPRFCRVPDPVKPNPAEKGIPLPSEPPRESQIGEMLGTQTHQRERLQREPRRVCGLTKECPVLDLSEGNQEDESWPVTSSGWSWSESEWGSHQD
jgi:hypothetical protein